MKRSDATNRMERVRQYALACGVDHFEEHPVCPFCQETMWSWRQVANCAREYKFNCGLRFTLGGGISIQSHCPTHQQASLNRLANGWIADATAWDDDQLINEEGGRDG